MGLARPVQPETCFNPREGREMHRKGTPVIVGFDPCFNPREGREMHLLTIGILTFIAFVSIPVRGARCIGEYKKGGRNDGQFQSP